MYERHRWGSTSAPTAPRAAPILAQPPWCDAACAGYPCLLVPAGPLGLLHRPLDPILLGAIEFVEGLFLVEAEAPLEQFKPDQSAHEWKDDPPPRQGADGSNIEELEHQEDQPDP